MRHAMSVLFASLVLGAGCTSVMTDATPAAPVNTLAGPVADIGCGALGELQSLDSTQRARLDIVNHRDTELTLGWIDYQGEEQASGSVPAGAEKRVNTYVTHPWVVRDAEGTCLAVYVSDYPAKIGIR